MANKRTEPEAPGGSRRKRAAPTIDLTATELTPADAPSVPEPQPDSPPSDAAAPPASAPPAPEQAVAEQPAQAANEAPPPDPEPVNETAPEPPPPPGAGRSTFYGTALAAGFVGAAIMAGVAAALWYGDLLPLPSAAPNDDHAQIVALRGQIQALQNRPPVADSKAVDALSARVNQLAGEIAKLPPGDKTVGERLTAADNALKSLGIALTALNRRNDDLAADAKQARARADAAEKAVTDLRASLQDVAKSASGGVPVAALDALQTRVAALEQAMKTARAEIGKTAQAAQAARLALSAAALRDTVESGHPFAAELEQAKALGADATALAPLAAFADTGVPGAAMLAQDLRALMPAMLRAAGDQTPSGNFLDRLQANASKLVHIQPIEAPHGAAPVDVLARIEVDAAKADIDAALADLAALPPAARAPAQAWVVRAKARAAAIAAARHFAAETARALVKS